MDLNIFQSLYDLAVKEFSVNPTVFIFLVLVSAPPYYYGWYGLAKVIIRFKKKYEDKNNNQKATDIIKEKNFILSLTINRIAWSMPYVYIIFWGENIPLWFWILFFGWITLSVFLFWNKLKEKITLPV
jgi:hypothetical protein